jgi:hypothetical protein
MKAFSANCSEELREAAQNVYSYSMALMTAL